MNENNVDIGGMCIELFLPSAPVRSNILIPRLTHGSHVVIVRSGKEKLTDCDALITQNPELSLGIRTADCAPICFSDGMNIGIAHVGWRGLSLGLIEKMLPHFDTDTLTTYVGPFLHVFEIQKDSCYDQLNQKFVDYIERQPDKLIFRFKDAILSLLPLATFDSRSTETDTSLPSYRRDKKGGHITTAVSFSA
jgi:copper oxidase (laccase) domain-containing protein